MFSTHRTFNLSTGVKSASIAVVNDGLNVDVVYHKTLVVSARRMRKYLAVTLRNGGWDTISTRLVINTTLTELGCKYRLIRHKNQTLLCPLEELHQYPDHKTGKPFESGSTVRMALV